MRPSNVKPAIKEAGVFWVSAVLGAIPVAFGVFAYLAGLERNEWDAVAAMAYWMMFAFYSVFSSVLLGVKLWSKCRRLSLEPKISGAVTCGVPSSYLFAAVIWLAWLTQNGVVMVAAAAGFALVYPLVAAEILFRQDAHLPDGWCAGCGYDMRATPGRCPECGLVPGPTEADRRRGRLRERAERASAADR